jgi:hypothetical protein
MSLCLFCDRDGNADFLPHPFGIGSDPLLLCARSQSHLAKERDERFTGIVVSRERAEVLEALVLCGYKSEGSGNRTSGFRCPATGPPATAVSGNSGDRRCTETQCLAAKLAVIVAMPVMLMMQMACNNVVRMVTVLDRIVTAARPMLMRGIVSGASVTVGACVRIGGCDPDVSRLIVGSHGPSILGSRVPRRVSISRTTHALLDWCGGRPSGRCVLAATIDSTKSNGRWPAAQQT